LKEGIAAGVNPLLSVDNEAFVLKMIRVIRTVANAAPTHSDLNIGKRTAVLDCVGQLAEGREGKGLALVVIEEQMLQALWVDNPTKDEGVGTQGRRIESPIDDLNRVLCH